MEQCDVCGETASTLCVCDGCDVVMCEDCTEDWHGTTEGDVCPKFTRHEATEARE